MIVTRRPTAQQIMEAPELLQEDKLRILHRYAQELENELAEPWREAARIMWEADAIRQAEAARLRAIGVYP